MIKQIEIRIPFSKFVIRYAEQIKQLGTIPFNSAAIKDRLTSSG